MSLSISKRGKGILELPVTASHGMVHDGENEENERAEVFGSGAGGGGARSRLPWLWHPIIRKRLKTSKDSNRLCLWWQKLAE